MILVLKFLIVCTIIGATFGDPWKDRKRRICSTTLIYYGPLMELINKTRKGPETDVITPLPLRSIRIGKLLKFNRKKMFKKLREKVEDQLDLLNDISDDITTPFESAIEALMTPRHEYLANELYNAINGIGTNDHDLIEILVPLNNHDIKEISAIYKEMYEVELKDDLADDTSGDFRDFLLSVLSANRSENLNVDVEAAIADARKLYEAGEGRVGTDESTFKAILLGNSFPQLGRTCIEYMKLYHGNLGDAIIKEFSGSILNGYYVVEGCAHGISYYFTYELYYAITHSSLLDVYKMITRIFVARSRIDLHDISNEYKRVYGKSLADEFLDHTEFNKYKNYICLMLELLDQ